MGCHTWFSRPVTPEEFRVFKEHALEEALRLCGETEENRELGVVDLKLYNDIKESVEKDTDYWWKLGYGTYICLEDGTILSELTTVIDGKLHLDLSKPINPIFEVTRYHDVFRVKNYPRKKIHSRRELRKWMGKKYFELSQEQLEIVSKFFRENPGGVITFG